MTQMSLEYGVQYIYICICKIFEVRKSNKNLEKTEICHFFPKLLQYLSCYHSLH